MNKNKGISLIVLVITIIVTIILVSVVIIALNNTGVIESSNEAVFKHNAKNYQTQLAMYLSGRTQNLKINLDKYTNESITDVLKMTEEESLKFEVIEGELVYIGFEDSEIKWCKEIGIKTINSYEEIRQTGGWEYSLNSDNTVTLIKYTGIDTKIVIPNRYRPNNTTDYYKVTMVQNNTTYLYQGYEVSCNILGEKLNNLTKSSTITEVKISNGIANLGDNVFSGLGISSLTIPETIRYMGKGIAKSCGKLTSITYNAIDCSSQNYQKDGMIYVPFEASPITIINVGPNVKIIPDGLLCGSRVSKLDLGGRLRNIGSYAFSDCTNLRIVNLDSNVQVIGKGAFKGDSNITINYKGTVRQFNNLNLGATNAPFYSASVNYYDSYGTSSKTIDGITWNYDVIDEKIENLYTDTADLTSMVTIPSTIDGKKVYSIGVDMTKRFFTNVSSFTGVTSVIIPEGVEIINGGAFKGESKLTSLNFPSSIKEIGKMACYGCTGLKGTLNLPSGLEKIKYGAFAMCSGYTGALIIPDTVTEIELNAFMTTTAYTLNFTSLKLGSGLKKIGPYAFQNCTKFANELVLPEGLEIICDGAFNHCNFSNTTLTIPSTLKKIGGDPSIITPQESSTFVFFDIAMNCTEYIVSENNEYFTTKDGILYNKDMTRLISVPNKKVFIENSFQIPEGIITLDEVSFLRNASIQTIILPNSYTISNKLPLNFLNLACGNSLTVAFSYCNIKNVQVKADNAKYTVINGCIYSKNGNTLYYIPSGYTGALTINSGTTKMVAGVLSTLSVPLNQIIIPSTMTNIFPSTISNLNSKTGIVKTVDTNNTVYTVLSGKIAYR